MSRLNLFRIGLVLGLALAFGMQPAYARNSKALQIKGSDTMVNLGQTWAEEFMYANPNESIAVTGGGSGTGISAIIGGTCDIAQSSRALKKEELHKAAEKGAPIKEIIVGYDGIAVVVHKANPLNEITTGQLSDIFSGKVTNWKELGGDDTPILILSRERNSGTHVFFLEEVVRKGNSKGPEEFSSKALMMPSNQAIVQEVSTSKAGIGYVGLGYVTDNLKILNVSKEEKGPFLKPSLASVLDGTYPIARPLYFFTRGEPAGKTKLFVDFALSDQGQEIVELLDFIPLKK